MPNSAQWRDKEGLAFVVVAAASAAEVERAAADP